jgi:hypothetical protein
MRALRQWLTDKKVPPNLKPRVMKYFAHTWGSGNRNHSFGMQMLQQMPPAMVSAPCPPWNSRSIRLRFPYVTPVLITKLRMGTAHHQAAEVSTHVYHKVLGRMPLFRGLSPDILIRLCQAVTPMMAVSGAHERRRGGAGYSRRCPDAPRSVMMTTHAACTVGHSPLARPLAAATEPSQPTEPSRRRRRRRRHHAPMRR